MRLLKTQGVGPSLTREKATRNDNPGHGFPSFPSVSVTPYARVVYRDIHAVNCGRPLWVMMLCRVKLISARSVLKYDFGMMPERGSTMADSDEIAIESMRQEFLKAYKTGDAAGLAACCADDVVQLPPNEPAVRGKQAVRTRYQAQFDRFACELSATTEELEIAGPWALLGVPTGSHLLRETEHRQSEITGSTSPYSAVKQMAPGSSRETRSTATTHHLTPHRAEVGSSRPLPGSTA